MACNCNCKKNGQDVQDFLLSSPTAGTYVLGLTHNTCGCRKMALSDPARPVVSNLSIAAVGEPVDMKQALTPETRQQCEALGRAMAERLKE